MSLPTSSSARPTRVKLFWRNFRWERWFSFCGSFSWWKVLSLCDCIDRFQLLNPKMGSALLRAMQLHISVNITTKIVFLWNWDVMSVIEQLPTSSFEETVTWKRPKSFSGCHLPTVKFFHCPVLLFSLSLESFSTTNKYVSYFSLFVQS